MHFSISIHAMGETQSLQQIMRENRTIQSFVLSNVTSGQYYLLGVYPVELTTPLSADIFTDAENMYITKTEKSELLEYIYRLIKEHISQKQGVEFFPCCTTSDSTSVSPPQERFIVPTAIYDAMDNNNKKAADIMANKGINASVEYMFTNPNTGQKWDYAAMRAMYG